MASDRSVSSFSRVLSDFLAIIYPRLCCGCGRSLTAGEEVLCTACRFDLPLTNHAREHENELFRRFLGRLSLASAYSYMHYYKHGIGQSILHSIKYRGRPEAGRVLSEWFGNDLRDTAYASKWDVIIPIPLHISRLKKRGFNQSLFIAEGLANSLNLPLVHQAVERSQRSKTQTSKSKDQRWENVEGIFTVRRPNLIKGLHVLLVDDVVTTGSTLESCGHSILAAGADQLSIATLAIAH